MNISIKELQQKAISISNEVKKVIIGKDDIIDKILIAFLAKGHILLEDIPGVGKTTLMLQHIKKEFSENMQQVMYVSLDNLYFTDNSLIDFVRHFVQRGGTHLFLDEVHKYPNWSQTIKNIYDDYPELSLVFTGSSLLEILNARADLSRRALVYDMQGLSFREFLSIKTGIDFPIYSLEEIIQKNELLSAQIVSKVKPFAYFEEYLKLVQ